MSAHGGCPAILCADIGTSSLKAAAIDHDGRLLAFAREPYPADRVAAGTVTAADWEAAFARACRGLFAASSTTAASGALSSSELSISAVCVSGNGPTLVPIRADGTVLDSLHWHDGRAIEGAEASSKKLYSFFLPRAAWLCRERPRAYERTRFFLSSQEWLSFRLGAEPVTVLPSAAYRRYYWDAAQLDAFGLDGDKFPPLVLLGERIGAVSRAAEDSFGIAAGTPIVAGGPDFFMALIGVGAIETGVVCDRAGTSEGLNVCADRQSRSRELRTLPQLRDGLWNVSAMLPTTGRLFEWFRSITGQTGRDYREMLEEIRRAVSRTFSVDHRPAAVNRGGFFFPDLKATEGLGAASAFISTAGLTDRAELGKAVLEAIGFLVRGGIETLERHGFRIEGMRLSGGQAKNEIWNRMKADMTGRVLCVPEIADGELSGDACVALAALGDAVSIEEAVGRVVRIDRVYEPDPRAFAFHSERYDSYRAMQAKMEAFFA